MAINPEKTLNNYLPQLQRSIQEFSKAYQEIKELVGGTDLKGTWDYRDYINLVPSISSQYWENYSFESEELEQIILALKGVVDFAESNPQLLEATEKIRRDR